MKQILLTWEMRTDMHVYSWAAVKTAFTISHSFLVTMMDFFSSIPIQRKFQESCPYDLDRSVFHTKKHLECIAASITVASQS